MSLQVEKLEKNMAKLTIEVSAEELECTGREFREEHGKADDRSAGRGGHEGD